MKPPTINLARRPFRNNSAFYSVFAACFVLLLAATIYNANDFFARGDELSTLRQRLADRSHRYTQIFQDVEVMKKEMARVNLSVLSQKSAFANGLIVSHLFSWSLLFDRLEEIIPYDVKIRAIRPAISAQEIEIQIDGMTKSAVDLYEFEARLSESEYFSSVYPLSENTRESRNEINFDLALSYIPAGKSGLDPSPPTPRAALPQPPVKDEKKSVEQSDAPVAGSKPVAQSSVMEPPAGVPPAPGSAPSGGDAASAPVKPAPAAGLPVAMPPQTPPATPAATSPDPAAGTPMSSDQPQEMPASGPAAAGSGTPAAAGDKPKPAAPGKGPALMTNREFLEFIGEDRFIRFRGPLVPIEPDEHGEATNAGLIRTIGLEAFLEARGDLEMQQQRKPAGGTP